MVISSSLADGAKPRLCGRMHMIARGKECGRRLEGDKSGVRFAMPSAEGVGC